MLDGASFEHGLVRGDDAVDLVALSGDTVTVQTLDGHAAAFALDGAERWRRADTEELEPPALAVPGVTLGEDDEPSSTTVAGTVLELPADGAALAAGAVWLYTDEGMLVAATRPSRP